MVWIWAAVAALLVIVVATLALRRRGEADGAESSVPAPAATGVPPVVADPATEIALAEVERTPSPPVGASEEPDDTESDDDPSDVRDASRAEPAEPEPAGSGPVNPETAAPEPAAGPGVPPPAGFAVKGNVGSMLYHTPDSPYFARTRAEAWFNSEDAAREAGFRRWDES